MAQSYRQFLDKSWGAGATSNANRAAAWRRANPPAAPAGAAKPNPAAPQTALGPAVSFTPGSLDVQGQQSAGQLDFSHNAGQQSNQLSYDQEMGELNAQRPQLDLARDRGYTAANNNAAARGMFKSGIREQNRTDVGADYDKGIRDLARQSMNAANRYQLGKDTLKGQYDMDKSNNMIDSNARQKTTFEEQHPVVTDTATAATPKTPAVKYKDWLKGRTSTAAMASAWRKAQGI